MISDEAGPRFPVWTRLAPSVKVEPLLASTRLKRSEQVSIEERDARVVKIAMGWRDLEFEDEDELRLAELLPRMDGSRDIAGLATECGWSLARTTSFAQTLYEEGVVINVGDTAVPSISFVRHARNLGFTRRWRLGQVPEGEVGIENPTRRFLLGHYTQIFHYVSAAASHIAPAITLAPNQRIQAMLSEYLSQEYWHGALLRKGLLSAGLSERDLDRSMPLPGIRGVIDFLRHVAASSLDSYGVCVAVTEAPGGVDVIEQQSAWWDKLLARELLPRESLEPFRDHTLLDMAAGHASLPEELFVDEAWLSRVRQDRLCRVLLAHGSAWGEAHRQIRAYFGSDGTSALYAPEWR